MSIQITSKKARNGQKQWYTFEWGKASNQRRAAGIFTYIRPKDQIQKNFNKEALALLEAKKAQLVIDQQSIGTPFIPSHRFKDNFLDYYTEFVANNKREGNRHLEGSLNQFKCFIRKAGILPQDITENFCARFRAFLLDRHTGKTPSDYFGAFKRVIKSATKDGYFRINPSEDIRRKTKPSIRVREFLEADEYLQLIKTPVRNKEMRDAFIFCCYTGLRWCDVNRLRWQAIKGDILVTKIIQKKTGKPVEITLHPVAQSILGQRKRTSLVSLIDNDQNPKTSPLIFHLPTAGGANKALNRWVKVSGIDKYIRWHSARLSFSILLQDANVDSATVALLLGHTTTRYVNETYKRHRPKNQSEHIAKLPDAKLEFN